MRYFYHVIIGATFIAIAAICPALAQSMPGVLGVYNPSTGQFQPAPVQMSAPSSTNNSAPRATVFRSGKFKFQINITVDSSSPSTTKPTCYVYVNHYPSGQSYSENSYITGTRTGDTAHCVVNVPYKWTKADNAAAVQMSVTIYLGNRTSGRGLPDIPLPANGTTTTVTVPITM